jgi:hypothetical protein
MENNKKTIQAVTHDTSTVSRRSFMARTSLLGAGLAFAPFARAASAHQSREINGGNGTEEFINTLADLMAHSTRTPILRWPNEYGMVYEEIFFPALDGVTVEGWFIPADSNRLIICNHPMPCNRYG